MNRDWQGRLLLATLVAAAAVLAWSLREALVITAPAPSFVRRDSIPRDELPSPPSPSTDRVTTALGKDPFNSERRRPGARFRMPGTELVTRRAARPLGARLRMIGTSARPDGTGFVMCAWEGGAPRILRLGERVGDWTLTKVLPGAAEFTTSSGPPVVVHVPKTGAGT